VKASPGGLHVSVRPIFTFGSDIFACSLTPLWMAPVSRAVRVRLMALCMCGVICGTLPLSACGVRDCRGACGGCHSSAWNTRQEENQHRAARGLPPRTRRRRRKTFATLAAAPGPPQASRSAPSRMALVADGEQGRGEQHEGRQARQAAPVAADVVAGGVLAAPAAAASTPTSSLPVMGPGSISLSAPTTLASAARSGGRGGRSREMTPTTTDHPSGAGDRARRSSVAADCAGRPMAARREIQRPRR